MKSCFSAAASLMALVLLSGEQQLIADAYLAPSMHCGINARSNSIGVSTRLYASVEDKQNKVEDHVAAASDPMVDTETERKYKEEIRALCAERNLPLEKVKNCRDLAATASSPIKPGRLFRTGRLGDATEKDQVLLFDTLGITTLVDLRSPTELKDDPALMSDVFDGFTDLVWMENGRRRDGCVRQLDPGVSPVEKKKRFKKGGGVEVIEAEDEMCEMGCDDPNALPAQEVLKKTGGRKERHFVSLMNEFKYVRGTVTKLRKRDIAKALFKAPGAFLSKRIWNSLKKPFITEINAGGLIMLNELLLRFGAPGIKYVLDLCAESDRHPVAFYCTAGKDRTGMISAIILSICGVKPEDIVEDYSLSANVYAEMNDHQAMVGALSQRSLDPKTFLGAPPEVMADTLLSIEENYGSVEGYCDFIGFGPEQREKLRKALTE
ncbi:protein tyrosine/serine phosphatase [Nitzschia inconspicua]|uniref:Protein tyrosine/serine phosphatase n=1 Tax=Nitzschia inconspicua TaxID=303405 RepID=A0A9K3PME6_9STRA|nr:protein tyrosine/serine phosphatase [Nitzschia inconspicua]